MAIEFYKEFGELGYLANYSPHSFTKNGILYKTVEHYYQSEKFTDPEIKRKIIEAPSPKEASCIGRDRTNLRRPHFKKIKNDVMYDGILEKFRQNRDIAYKLIETRNESIAEATIDEYYWGIGKDRTGQNHIGQIIARVRSTIKSEILSSIIEKARSLKEVYVIGHKAPDADSIFSSYILTNILKSLNINAHFAILDSSYEYTKTDAKLIKSYLPVQPVVVSPKDKYFILVDHNNLEGLDESQVIGAIDHHIITGEVYDTLEIEYSSTGLLIYDLFRNTYNFSEEERKIIYLTVLGDTDYLCSKARYKDADAELVSSLNISLDISALQKECFVTTDFSQPINENIYSNYKEYERNNTIIYRTLIYSYTPEYEKYYQSYLNYISKLPPNWLLIWCDFEAQKTYIYYNGITTSYNYITTSTNVILKQIL